MSESDTMFNERDRRCAAVQLMLSTDLTYDNRTIASTLKIPIWIATNNRNVPRMIKTKFPDTVMVFGVLPHIFAVGLKVNIKVYLYVLKSVVITWCNQVAGGSRSRRRPTSPKRPRLSFRRSATTLYSSLTGPLLPRPEPTELLRLVIRREHHQHDLPQHQSQPDRRHPPSIHRTPAGACGKNMLLVPDLYQAGD